MPALPPGAHEGSDRLPRHHLRMPSTVCSDNYLSGNCDASPPGEDSVPGRAAQRPVRPP
ncbi:hypothetical protein CZ774_09745 [Frigoribacterium sp. JB110]|nr:hypothetical protein CZ774_09745 [Frigoribacterium sp. JB110]